MRRCLIFFVVLSMMGCTAGPKKWNTSDYTVRSGDTIFSIAWRYEIDVEELMRWNRLNKDSVIYPGQRLHTRNPSSFIARQQAPSKKAVADTVKVRPGDTLFSIAQKNDMSVEELADLNRLQKPYVINPGQELKLKKQGSGTVVESIQKKPTHKAKLLPSREDTEISWQWPVAGKVVKSFNSRLNDAKGIDIHVTDGAVVRAAAGGKVVYSGNGLISYGNLIIIKHNDRFLSAYAQNRKLLVSEGENVKAGQKIAMIKAEDGKNPRLHFEIRKNGKPVNPERYLPSS